MNLLSDLLGLGPSQLGVGPGALAQVGWLDLVHWVPLVFRLLWLFALGAAVGSFLNVCIYRLPLGISLGGRSRCMSCGKPIAWRFNIPVLSWFLLGGRCGMCGQPFSFRYPLVESLTGFAFAGLYWWEVEQRALFPPEVLALPGVRVSLEQLYLLYGLHITLCCFLIVAAMIDFDYWVIPDIITVPGTLFALVYLTLFPAALLPHWQWTPFTPLPGLDAGTWEIGQLGLTSELLRDLPAWLQGGTLWSLLIALGCFFGWAAALFPWDLIWRPWSRKGWRWALRVAQRGWVRKVFLHQFLQTLVCGVLVVGVWWFGGRHFSSLLTALVGLGIAGGVVWSIRIVAGLAMQQEALGFGDVTLMAMLGACLGWQAGILLFFMGVFYGLIMGVLSVVLKRNQLFPYGPSLCLGAATVTIGWGSIWDQYAAAFSELGGFLALVLPLCLGIMGVLLVIMRAVRVRLFGDRQPEFPSLPGE